MSMTVSAWETRPQQAYFGPACWQTRLSALLAYIFLHTTLAILTIIGIIINRLCPFLVQKSRLDIIDKPFAAIRPVPGTTTELVQLEHCQAEWVVAPQARESSNVIIYFHGSALVTFGLNSHRRFCSKLSAMTHARVFNVGYRLAPQATLQETIEDGVDAYKKILELGYQPDHVILAGDSAGGLLVPTTAVLARDQGLPVPAGQVLLSPLTSEDMTIKYQAAITHRDPCFPYMTFAFIYRAFATRNGKLPLPIMPSRLDLHGLGPCLIQVSNTEMLRNDAFLLADRLENAGVKAWIQVWDHALHTFQATFDVNPDAQHALREITDFIHYAMGEPVSSEILS